MDLIKVNQEKCIKCGICAEVCPTGTIGLDENGPKAIEPFCIACGHCVAICPTAALDNAKAPLVNQISLKKVPVLDEDMAAIFLRSRRSVREFKRKVVARESIQQLLNIARFAPTSSNSQGVSYLVIDDFQTLSSITAVIVDYWEEEALKQPPWSETPYAAHLKAHIANYRKTGRDVILRDAPCLIIPIVDKNLTVGKDNTYYSLAYAELYAPSIGLGTCITGFFDGCAASGYKPLLEILKLPENMQVTGGLMAGYPKYTYQRLVDRNPLQVIWR